MDTDYRLDSRYTRGLTEPEGKIFISGTQALVRMMLMQAALDRANGKNTAGYVTGYRGSPLGGVDKEMLRAESHLKEAGIRFQPAINEDLAATALIGTQKVESDPTKTVDGVFSLWYGKGPGIDRSGDALKHGNAYGSSPTGGVLVVAGDDHGCVSSSMSHQSDLTLMAWYMPVIHPSSIAEYVTCALWGWALSRFSGTWVGFKAISEAVESSASVLTESFPNFTLPNINTGPDGLHWRWPDLPGMQIERRLEYKLNAVKAFAQANPLDSFSVRPNDPQAIIVAVGKAYADVREALRVLGISDDKLKEKGIALLKVMLVYPLSPLLCTMAKEVKEVIIIEEKEPVVENLLKQYLYNVVAETRPLVTGKSSDYAGLKLPRAEELRPSIIGPELIGVLRRYGIGTDLPDSWIPNRNHIEKAPVEKFREVMNHASSFEYEPPLRTPYFCSGCPHNTSTKIPEGSRAQLGIGCHAMAVNMDRNTSGSVQMGGEGVDWVGQTPFVAESHIFQNLGDGTFSHSGHLAIRQAVAADINITYKILYNDAVAMTGGQPIDMHLSVPQICRILIAEGVRRVVVLTNDPAKYPNPSDFPDNVQIQHRNALDRVQRELRVTNGVTVIVYDQVCATEKRRREKRADTESKKKVVLINEMVCEGCGDCQIESNCLSVIPIETQFGRKRAIDSETCNADYSCLNGFCPSFVTVDRVVDKNATNRIKDYSRVMDKAAEIPVPNGELNKEVFSILVAGVGGTGIVTLSTIVAMAAHLQGVEASVLDFTGFAQKGGSVLSHIKLSRSPGSLNQVRIDTGCADAFIVSDLLVGTQKTSLSMLKAGVTQVVANLKEVQTGSMLRDTAIRIEAPILESALVKKVGADSYRSINMQDRMIDLVDPMQENILLLGFAWQSGLIPIWLDALMRAIELNGVQVEENKIAFAWGRILSEDPGFVKRYIGDARRQEADLSVNDLVDKYASYLKSYQNAKYAGKYLEIVERAKAASYRMEDESIHRSVAKALFKLMAYKDEYEVARLLSDKLFLKNINDTYGSRSRISYYLSPPLLGIIGGNKDKPRKYRFGPWVIPILKLLASLRVIRGTAIDVFGYSSERNLNRRMIDEYEAMLDVILPLLTKENINIVLELVLLPLSVKGYGHVMIRSFNAMQKQQSGLVSKIYAESANISELRDDLHSYHLKPKDNVEVKKNEEVVG